MWLRQSSDGRQSASVFSGISKACVFVFSANYTKDSGRPVSLCRPAALRRKTGVPLMEVSMMFVDCPAYLDNSGSVRCGLPAEVEGQVSLPGHVDHGGPGAGSWRAPAS